MRPIEGTITDPRLDRLWRNEDAQFTFDQYDDAEAPAPTNVVRLSRGEAAWLIEAALKHARKHGQGAFVSPLIEKLWGAYTA